MNAMDRKRGRIVDPWLVAGLTLSVAGVVISSFFDVFTEISLDSGQTWSPVAEPTHLELQNNGVVLTP